MALDTPWVSLWYAIVMLKAQSLEKEKAYSRLLDLILSGQISDNVPLAERRLAERLGIGRTPVREAIKDLVREGVLEAHPTRGTFVRQLSLRDVQEIYQLRFRIALGMPRHHDPDRVFESVGEHLNILEAIEARDGALAQKLICDHLHRGLEVRTRLFQSRNRYAPLAALTPAGSGW